MEAQSSSSAVNETLQKRLAKLAELRDSLPEDAYSIVLRLKLAIAYRNLGYPDLAVGEAYKALLLTDEVAEEGEFHHEALSAAKSDISSTRAIAFANEVRQEYAAIDHTKCCCTQTDKPPTDPEELDDNEAMSWAKSCWSKTAYAILVGCLIDCGCLRSAFEYNTRALKSFSQDALFYSYRETTVSKLRSYFHCKGDDFDAADVDEYPDKGTVRREQYPWNEHEPDRFSSESLQILNDQMAEVAPKLEVKKTTLQVLSPRSSENPSLEPKHHYVDQLGIFAKEDIPPGEVILQEKSLLTAISRLRDSFCDACSVPLSKSGEAADSIRACDECDEVYFCSEDCEELAQTMYHPALCGVSIDQKVSASEASDLLYSLLLIRALALAEVQELHPLELKEVRFIWGDYHGLKLDRAWSVGAAGQLPDPFGGVPQSLPFSFKDNISTPLNVLERMDINIFEQSHRYDTWVFNTLYAKFRGTASARQGLDGRPEVSAVHPMWCLGNHSCDPNVEWDWQGSIKFWTREKLVDWKGRDPAVKPGIRKGEELMSHYCDVSLPVRERREWAVGALGGNCMCPRCVWEAAEEEGRGKE